MRIISGTARGTKLYTLEGENTRPTLDRVKAVIFLQGKDALFVEFGAGIYYNNGDAHPLAAEFGYGVGTYPSKNGHNRAINPGYWWYKDDNGTLNLSLGTKAAKPMYEAAQNARNTAIMTAMSVFKG